MKTKRTMWTIWVMVCVFCVLGAGTIWAVEEPNGLSGTAYSTSGETEVNGECPSWVEILPDRYSTDTHTDERLIVEIDACQIIIYDVNSIEQGTTTPIALQLKKDDIWIEWDEDSGDGSRGDFTFTGDYTTDPNTDYFQVSSTNNNIINWTVYQADENGTLTITSTVYNEHDVIHLFRNEIDFTKVDDANDCVSPDDEMTYTICWDNEGVYSYTDCYIVDWLPEGVTYPGGDWRLDPNNLLNPIPPDPSYDPNTHSYVYLDLGTIAPGDANCVTLDVVVNEKAEPGMKLYNVADLYSDDELIARATEDTLVCCWDDTDPNIIYVDITASGNDNGTNWTNAYSGRDGLTKALNRIENSVCDPGPNTIYVAQGIYDPNNTPEWTFELPDGVSVYGGFKSGGDTFSNREPKKYETILTGLIDDDAFPDADIIVTMGDETLLDGFTVTGASASINASAIYGSGVDFTIENCKISGNENYGIRAIDSDTTVKWCEVKNNKRYGIRHDGTGYAITVENCQIRKNSEYGIYCLQSTPTIKNTIISENDLSGFGREGIHVINPTYSPVLHNNTLAHNRAEGIFFVDDETLTDPNDKDWPDIQNCIIYYNNNNGIQFENFGMNRVHYSCVYDPNDPNGTNLTPDNNYNFSAKPKLAYFDPNNVHLAYDSPCKDAGSLSLSYTGQVDMDSEDRVVGDAVDIGADELYSCDGDYTEDDFHNDLDWNADGLVNLHEFSFFQKAWLSDDPNSPGDPNLIDSTNWNPDCNLDSDPNGNSAYVIDLADLAVFVSDTPWLWKACWYDDYTEMYGMMSGGGESSSMLVPSAVEGMAVPMSMSMDSTAKSSVPSGSNYANMPTTELVTFVKGIYEVIDDLETMMLDDPKNAENYADAKDFLEDVLTDIKTARQ